MAYQLSKEHEKALSNFIDCMFGHRDDLDNVSKELDEWIKDLAAQGIPWAKACLAAPSVPPPVFGPDPAPGPPLVVKPQDRSQRAVRRAGPRKRFPWEEEGEQGETPSPKPKLGGAKVEQQQEVRRVGPRKLPPWEAAELAQSTEAPVKGETQLPKKDESLEILEPDLPQHHDIQYAYTPELPARTIVPDEAKQRHYKLANGKTFSVPVLDDFPEEY
jgi:hypothetical protein